MLSTDPRMRPTTAPILDHDVDLGYTGRVIRTIAWFFGALLIIGFLVGRFFFQPPIINDVVKTEEIAQTKIIDSRPINDDPLADALTKEEQMPSEKSAVYHFFYSVFGGIKDGLEENPRKLTNTVKLDGYDLDGTKRASPSVQAALALDDYAEQIAAAQNQKLNTQEINYRNSLYDAINKDVADVDGNKVGNVYDIIVDLNTKEAAALIIDSDDNIHQNDLRALSFSQILEDDESKPTRLGITETQIDMRQPFTYEDKIDEMPSNLVSLRQLQKSRLLDFEGNIVGDVDGIIYRDEEAQSLYFEVRSSLVPQDKSSIFRLPFEALNIKKSDEGYNIYLTKEQTQRIAEYLYSNQ